MQTISLIEHLYLIHSPPPWLCRRWKKKTELLRTSDESWGLHNWETELPTSHVKWKAKSVFSTFRSLIICRVTYPKFEMIKDDPVNPQDFTPNISSELQKLPCKCIKIYCPILLIKPTWCTNTSKFIFGSGVYMFRTVSLSIVRSLALYTQQYV